MVDYWGIDGCLTVALATCYAILCILHPSRLSEKQVDFLQVDEGLFHHDKIPWQVASRLSKF